MPKLPSECDDLFQTVAQDIEASMDRHSNKCV